MKDKNYIPKTTHDTAAVGHLKYLPFDSVKQDIPILLEWLQDAHWEVAKGVAEYLVPYINKITRELLFILDSDDGMWKYCVIILLIAQSEGKLEPSLIKALRRIAEHPSKIEVEDTVDEVAKDVIANKALCG